MAHVKDFDNWNIQKKQINNTEPRVFFHVREVWWCKLGINVGFEQDGKNQEYSRPVVILKTYSTNAALIVPLTSKDKKGTYYFNIGKVGKRDAKAVLSQIRFIDKRRLIKKLDVVNKEVFEKLQSALIQINFT
ncbi:MAG TPA: type II toxin-antitoxin system PemK/MazF family toxin [Candidatus Andersenbacteria bacterium]|nr:type II toxin-antitoxin system PemK/MazF family toxin [Candidatus Andersenbacteria bacterium]